MIKRITTIAMCDKFLKDKELKGLKQSTIATYYSKMEKHIIPNFPKRVYKIKEEKVCKILIGISKKVGKRTFKDIVVLMNSLLKFAHDKRYMKTLIKIPCPLVQHNEVVTFTDVEQAKLEKYLLSNPNSFNFGIFLVLYTGLRIGELSALLFDDIGKKSVKVDKTLQRIKNLVESEMNKTIIVIDTPKSKSSIREIPIISAIKEYYQRISHTDKLHYVLTDNERFIEPRSIERHFENILKECQIESKNFHVLRHTFATNCVKQGVDIKVLSQIMGHTNTNITLKYYVYIDFAFKEKNMNKLTNKDKNCN